jgi:hypothetical protein
MSFNKSLKFIPLIDLNRSQMIDLLNKSKIYIDLGNHPGMDRIPREASLCGCICLFADQGSVSNSKDVPVNDLYKIDIRDSFEKICVEKIDHIFSNYKFHYDNQLQYRNFIFGQKNLFTEQAENLINTILYNC